MKIGIVVPGFSACESDWCIPTLLSLVRRLAEEHHVRVFALRYPFRASRYRVYAAEVCAFGGADRRGLGKIPLLFRAVAAIRREHRREPFDVLHGFWADEPGYVAVRAARGLGIPSVVTLLGGELVSLPAIGYGGQRSRLNRLLAAQALAGASRVTAGSRYLASLAARMATPTFFPIGVDLDRFSPGEEVPSLLEGGTRLLHVGSLVPVKGHRTLLRAFAEVHRAVPDAVLHLVGAGPLERELRRRTRGLGLERQVVFHGAVPHHELPRYYRSADLALSSSLHEGQGWATQEAAGCARTTVGTEVGVVPDLEPATVAVPPENPGALARAVVDVLSDRPRLRARGHLAREKAMERHSLASTLKALPSLYRFPAKEET